MCNPVDATAADRVAKESSRNGTVLCHVRNGALMSTCH